ncbi:MAG: SH3 domain-containing protein [Pseudomonadota bacterium]
MKYQPTPMMQSLLNACRLQARKLGLITTSLAVAGAVLCTPAFALTTGPSGLPLPRYVSLKSERVNMRIGPGQAYQVQWLYVKRGLPMEIIQEYDNWRKVRDPEGNEGWVLHSLLSGQRTAIVAPWSGNKKLVSMRRDPDNSAPLSARLEPGVVVAVDECADGWCKLSAEGVAGFVDQKLLWGVYPGENF